MNDEREIDVSDLTAVEMLERFNMQFPGVLHDDDVKGLDIDGLDAGDMVGALFGILAQTLSPERVDSIMAEFDPTRSSTN